MDGAIFDRLAPRCPLCLAAGRDAPLGITAILRGEPGGKIAEGILGCPEPGCRREYPIVDGVPLLFSDLVGVIAGQGGLLLERQDLSPEMESLLGDAFGPGSAYDTHRQHLSTYAESHWGDLAEPRDAAGVAAAASFLRLLERALELAAPPAGQPILDLGCALGRASFELANRLADRLAERLEAPVLGADLHLGLVRRAAAGLASGRFHFPRRQVGLVYERAAVDVRAGYTRLLPLDFWAADALRLPFAAATFGAVLALNLIDCVAAPLELLRELRRVLIPGGVAYLATPWDWSAGSTPFPAWLGGHSQRGGRGGRSGEILRGLLAGGGEGALDGFTLAGEAADLPWRLRLHQRSSIDYSADLLVLRRTAAAAQV